MSFAITFHIQSQIKVNASGKVGIAGYEPSNSYSIRGESASYYNADFNSSYSINNGAWYSYVYEAAAVGQNISNNYSLRIRPSQNVINTLYITDGSYTTSGTTLHVDGDATITGTLHNPSDRRLKKEVDTIDSKKLFRKLSKIRGKRYKFKSRKELLAMHESGEFKFTIDTIYKKIKIPNKEKPGDSIRILTDDIKRIRINTPKFNKGKQYGIIAQDVIEEFPELVSLDENSGVYSVNYVGFIPLLIEAVNLQKEEVSKMSRQIDRLKERIKVLEAN
ncbi:hypothetical protein GCM10011368_07430 [Hyunsoonleella pacifica]|nr:hypothetical protein GCM10011368_07430 [Hyunsoonleella pacifica]